ncbi:MAG: cation transporter [Clostridiales bacterium]|nr:cation transporter [Clostridiales bacterium]
MVNEQQVNKIGKTVSVFGIILNILLAASKICIGSIFGLISVVADGLNNLTDCGSSVTSLISFKMSSRPADKEHPYGHGRIEYVCSLLIAFLMFFVAFDMAKESITKIISPMGVDFSVWIIVVLALSILIKFIFFLCCKIASKKINSTILSTTALDSLMDCIATFITLASYIVAIFTGFNPDGYVGVIIALFIAWLAFKTTKEIVSTLIGEAPEQSLVDEIKEKILSYDGVLAVHDLAVYNFGANKYFATAHVEVSAKVDVMISHELIDKIERDFSENTNILFTGHLDPIEVDNPLVNELRDKVENVVKNIDDRFSIHDFRIVLGKQSSNMLFDVAIPFENTLSKNEIKAKILDEIKKFDGCYNVIMTIEHTI